MIPVVINWFFFNATYGSRGFVCRSSTYIFPADVRQNFAGHAARTRDYLEQGPGWMWDSEVFLFAWFLTSEWWRCCVRDEDSVNVEAMSIRGASYLHFLSESFSVRIVRLFPIFSPIFCRQTRCVMRDDLWYSKSIFHTRWRTKQRMINGMLMRRGEICQWKWADTIIISFLFYRLLFSLSSTSAV